MIAQPGVVLSTAGLAGWSPWGVSEPAVQPTANPTFPLYPGILPLPHFPGPFPRPHALLLQRPIILDLGIIDPSRPPIRFGAQNGEAGILRLPCPCPLVGWGARRAEATVRIPSPHSGPKKHRNGGRHVDSPKSSRYLLFRAIEATREADG